MRNNPLLVQFANKTALRIALSAVLALAMALAIPYHPEFWFGWFAPFSVIINMLMFPYQNRYHAIMWERLIGVGFGTLFSVLVLLIFQNVPLLFCIAVFLFCLWCMYHVGNHHHYHYAFFLAMIFGALAVSFMFTSSDLTEAIWQFPATVVLAIIAMVIVDWVIMPHTAEKHLPKMLAHAQRLLLDAGLSSGLDIQLYRDWQGHLQQARLQFSAKAYQQASAQLYHYRLLAQKHNDLVKHYQAVSDKDQQTMIATCHHLLQSYLQQRVAERDVITCLQQLERHIEGNQDAAAWRALHELHLMHEDISHIQQAASGETLRLPPAASAEHHHGFNPAAFVFSLRTVTAVTLSLLLVYSLHLPGGVQTIIATIVTAAAPNTGASILKVLMRGGGIIVGSLAGYVVLLIIANTQSLILYLLLFAGFVFIAARWGLLSKHYGYAGIQAALLFLIMISNTGTSRVDLTLSTERLEGVLVGGLIAFVLVFLLSPHRPLLRG